jgi:CelD/BcsL family acetyltransferase involved in cellulose biosynthesis
MEFILHRNFDKLDPLAGEWNNMLAESVTHVPFLRHEYLRTWWETRGGGEWPDSELAVILARHEDGRLAGIAPLFSYRNQDGHSSLLLLGSIEISDYLDLIVRPADLPVFVSGLFDFLSRQDPSLPDWHSVDLHNLCEDTPTLPVLEAEAGRRGWTFAREQTYLAPTIPLAGDFDAYLAGIDKKQRHEIRRKLRRAEESGNDVRWYMVTDGDRLEAEVDAFLALMAEEPDKASFLTPPMRRQMHLVCRAAFDNGWLQLAFLEANGCKTAGYLNFDYMNRIWVYNSGLDRNCLDLSPGWVLLGYLIRWAIENGRTEFDFMRGGEDYKYRFGAVDRRLVKVTVSR